MSKRRPHLAPWRTAGRVSEAQRTADDVVRETGWVFNNETGEHLTLAEFVATGTTEVGYFCHFLGLFWGEHAEGRTFVEIGSGIGRMTAALTQHYSTVVACDLDGAFLERCRETVSQHGRIDRLRTVHMADGRSLATVDDASADVVFSYITLQHCEHDTAVALIHEALRAVKPGGRVALNFRTWTGRDALLFPLGALVRFTWRVVPSRIRPPRLVTRIGWQANRLGPEEVVTMLQRQYPDLALTLVFQSDQRSSTLKSPIPVHRLIGVHPSHWWLVVQR